MTEESRWKYKKVVMMNLIGKELNELRKNGLFRELKKIKPLPEPNRAEINGIKALTFCSNDYLGLSRHPEVIEAGLKALEKYGAGSVASRYISGNNLLYEELESEIAMLKKTQKAIVFSSGYLTNIGTITALAGRTTNIYADKLCHASIIDGCKLSSAKLYRFKHNDLSDLSNKLKNLQDGEEGIIITEDLFSMDGDRAPVKQVCSIAVKNNCVTIIDCAHSTGILDTTETEIADIQMGTLSKAIGGLGGFIACSGELAGYIINKARPLMYTTALPPAVLSSAIAAIKIIRNNDTIKKKLKENIRFARKRLSEKNFCLLGDKDSPIIPILVNDSKKALDYSNKLLEFRIYVPAIRPPSVPPNKARLRITVNALHKKDEIEELADKLSEATGLTK